MSTLNHLIETIEQVKKLSDSAKTAEKAKVAMIKEAAAKKFQEIYHKYTKSLLTNNSQSVAMENHAELQVLLAEAALATDHISIARTLVQRYLQLEPQRDQFYCRARLVFSRVIQKENLFAKGDDFLRIGHEALTHVLMSLDVCLAPENVYRYRFLCYNTSVIAWQIIHPFMRPSRAKHFSRVLSRVSTSLETINDPDTTWRISFWSATAYAYFDDNQSKNASDCLDKAISMAERLVTESQGRQSALSKDFQACCSETEDLMTRLRKWEEYEDAIRNPKKKIDPDADPEEAAAEDPTANLPPPPADASYDELKQKLDLSQSKKNEIEEKMRSNDSVLRRDEERLLRLYLQRVHVNPSDAKRLLTLPLVAASLRMRVLINLQMIRSVYPDPNSKDAPLVWAAIMKDLTESPVTPSTVAMIAETLLDVSRFAWVNRSPDNIAKKCQTLADEKNAVSIVVRVKSDICKALELVNEGLTKNPNGAGQVRLNVRLTEAFVAKSRVEAVKLLERTLTMCASTLNSSSGSSQVDLTDLVEELCLLAWNVAYPLLQPLTRSQVHRLLQLMATTLETLESNLTMLRTYVHFELSRCEENADFIVKARDEVDKALKRDYGLTHVPVPPADGGPVPYLSNVPYNPPIPELDRNRVLDHILGPAWHVLDLRTKVYDRPGSVGDQVVLLLQQVKESSSKSFQRDMLRKSAAMMIDDLDGSGTGQGGASAVSTTSSVSAKELPLVPLDDLVQAVSRLVVTDDPVPAGGTAPTLTQFTRLHQMRVSLMTQIGKFAVSHRETNVMQHCAKFVLSGAYKITDPFFRGLVESQVDALYFLCESLVESLAKVSVPAGAESVQDGEEKVGDYRALGLDVPAERGGGLAPEVRTMKELVVQSLSKALRIGVTLGDSYIVNNTLVYFWNLHVHIFRGGLYSKALPQVGDFVKQAYSVMDTFRTMAASPAGGASSSRQLDESLQVALIEAHVMFTAQGYGAQPPSPQPAIEIGNRGLALPLSAFSRRKLCETTVRLIEGLNAAGAAAAGGKGGAKPQEVPKYDHPFLNMYATLASMDAAIEFLVANGGFTTNPALVNEKLVPLVTKGTELMKGEVTVSLSQVKMDELPQEAYDGYMEMQVECWTRLTRGKILIKDILGAQDTSEACLKLIADRAASEETPNGPNGSQGSTVSPQQGPLSPRVWRWVSLCEAYFGTAITQLIQGGPESKEGGESKESGGSGTQDETLQNELRLAALRHFTLGCKYGLEASRDELIVTAASRAWNVTLALVDDIRSRESVLRLVTQILTQLKTVGKSSASTATNTSSKNNNNNNNNGSGKTSRHQDVVALLTQQFYLAMIHILATSQEWDRASGTVAQAFEDVPTSHQKPLWKWKVITMSKRGKSILDGLQKLKESDRSLQAKVFAVLARASSSPSQQLTSYSQAMESLSGDLRQVDYILETSQWMASAGVPVSRLYDMVLSALDMVYEYDETLLAQMSPSGTSSGGGTSAGDEVASATSDMKSRRSTGTKKSVSLKSQGPGGARSVTSRATSKRGGAGADEGPVHVTPELSHLEAGLRSAVMVAMLESQAPRRMERILEGVYYIQRFVEVWFASVGEGYRQSVLADLNDPSGQTPPIDPHTITIPLEFSPPRTPLDYLTWTPSTRFTELMQSTKWCNPLSVPSNQSITRYPLTWHYIIWLCDQLEQSFGCTAMSLQILQFARILLNYVSRETPNSEVFFAAIHTRTLRLLSEMGLNPATITTNSATPAISTTGPLPGTNRSLNDVISHLIAKRDELLLNLHTSSSSSSETENTSESKTNVFGLTTFTPVIRDVDVDRLVLMICRDLLSFNQGSGLGRSLLVLTQNRFLSRKDVRGVAESQAMLSELALEEGNASEALALALSCSQVLEGVSDPKLLGTVVTVVMKAFNRLNQVSQAVASGKTALKVLRDTAMNFIQIPSTSSSSSSNIAGQRLNASSMTMTTSRGGTSSRRGTPGSAGDQNNNNNNASEVAEFNADAAWAYAEVSMRLSESMLEMAFQRLSSSSQGLAVVSTTNNNNNNNANRDIARLPFAEVVEVLDDAMILVRDVLGPESLSLVDILTAKATAITTFIQRFHVEASRLVPKEVYSTWVEEQLSSAITAMQSGSQIIRTFFSRMPTEERILSRESRSTYLARRFGRFESQLAYFQIILGYFSKHRYILREASRDGLNAVELFIREAEAPKSFVADDFINPVLLDLGMNSAAAVSNEVKNSRSEIECSTLLESSKVVRETLLLESSRGNQANNNAASNNTIVDISKLTNQLRNAINENCWKVSEMAISVLCNASFANYISDNLNNQPTSPPSPSAPSATVFTSSWSNRTALWILYLQSLRSRQWMESQWRACMNPLCEVAKALNRIESVESRNLTLDVKNKLIQADIALLKASSVPYRRLDVTADLRDVLRNHVPPSTVVLSIQSSVSGDEVFICAGYDYNKAMPLEDGALPGKWVVDKMSLDEDKRRLLQTLVQQHRKWYEEVMKFSSMYGEMLPLDSDLDGLDLRYGDKNAMKQERAIEERLRALLHDLEQVFSPLISSGSRVDQFLTQSIEDITNNINNNNAKTNRPTPPSLMLLIDPNLQVLPFEGLSVLCKHVSGCIGRDFSMHLFGHRCNTLGINFNANASVLSVSSSLVKVISDPLGEDEGCHQHGIDRHSISKIVSDLMSETPNNVNNNNNKVNGGKKWQLIAEIKGSLSLQDLITVAESGTRQKPSTLLVYCPGRFASLFSPREYLSINLEALGTMVLIDLAHNDTSMRRQNALDNLKSPLEVSYEHPMVSSMLLSLSGIGAVMSQQWSTTFSAHKRLVENTLPVFTAQPNNNNATLLSSMASATYPIDKSIKKWISLPRVYYGVQSVFYADA